jgi:type IV pilus assembly protein PilY1
MYYRGTVYIGSNDGMLHAINATNGHERFCYVPNLVYGHLAELAMPDYSHRYYVDGTADAARVGTQHLLVSGLGKGGKGYFCLDITNPDSMGPGNVMWEYPSGADDDLGYTFSTPDIANTRAEGQVVIFGNGYDSENENAVLYVLDVSDGSVIKKFDTLAGNCNGLGTPSLVDVNADGYVDFAFAGDLKGNLWKFDLRGASSDDWKFYYQSGTTPMPLVTVKNSDGTAQPITVAPEVMLDCVRTYYGNGLMVIFGTGRYLTTDDLGDTTPHTFYGIWDWGDVWEAQYDHDTAKTKYLGDVLTDRSLSNIDNTVLLGQTVEYETDDWLVLSGNEIDYYNPSEETGQHMGWYFDLPVSGERCIRDPRLRMGVAVMVSTTPSESPCEAGGSSVIYQIDACTGGRTNGPQFDIDGDDIIDDDDLINGFPPTGKKTDSMLFSPIDMSDKLYFSTSDAGLEAVTVNPNPPGMLYWRLIQ